MINRAIITGATGFIGSNLCRELVNQGWKISIISRRTSDYSNLNDIIDEIEVFEYDGEINNLITWFKKTNADVVYHLAANSVYNHSSNQIYSLIDSNIKFGVEILEAMKFSSTKLIINTGSYWQHYNKETFNPVNLYSATKEAFITLMRYYIETESIRCLTLKLFDTYGENDIRPKLFTLLKQHSDNEKTLDVSPGEQLIDLVYIDDVVNAYIMAYDYMRINKNIRNIEFGVGTKKPIRLKEIIEIYEKLSEKSVRVNFGGLSYRNREVMVPWDNYETLPGWKCKVTLREGLKKYTEKIK